MILLKLVLTKNNFEFNEEHYLQIAGTAMGTRVAPSYANIFMAQFEQKFVDIYKPHSPFVWKRYIDLLHLDTWRRKVKKFHSPLKHLSPYNKIHCRNFKRKKQFPRYYSDQRKQHPIHHVVYKTDSHNYLRFESCHPYHLKKSLPFSLFLRVKRICTKTTDFFTNAKMIAFHCKRRGYPDNLIVSALEDLLKPKSKKESLPNNTISFMIVTYSPGLNQPKQIIKDNWKTLGMSKSTSFLYKSKSIFGNRRCKNAKDYVVRARVNRKNLDTRPTAAMNKCTNNCRHCPRLNTMGRITSTTTHRSYSSKTNVSCKSSRPNLIYCITCTTCIKQYVGQTKNRLIDRFQGHNYNITAKKLTDPIGTLTL